MAFRGSGMRGIVGFGESGGIGRGLLERGGRFRVLCGRARWLGGSRLSRARGVRIVRRKEIWKLWC